jgi:hypothetical protein
MVPARPYDDPLESLRFTRNVLEGRGHFTACCGSCHSASERRLTDRAIARHDTAFVEFHHQASQGQIRHVRKAGEKPTPFTCQRSGPPTPHRHRRRTPGRAVTLCPLHHAGHAHPIRRGNLATALAAGIPLKRRTKNAERQPDSGEERAHEVRTDVHAIEVVKPQLIAGNLECCDAAHGIALAGERREPLECRGCVRRSCRD